MNEEDCFVFCADDPITVTELEKIVLKAQMLPFSQEKEVKEGACVKDDKMHISYRSDEYTMYLRELALEGKHNLYNSMAAGISAGIAGIRKEDIRRAYREIHLLP